MTNTQMFTEERMYHIRVKGELDAQWSDWFEGFVMAARENGSTLLSGTVVDQAALHGVLDKLHSLGLPLLLVMQASCPCSRQKCVRHGNCRECMAHYDKIGGLPFCFKSRTRWDKVCTTLTGIK